MKRRKAMSGIFIVAAKRTPFGAFGGSLSKVSAVDLGVVATKAALSAGNIDPSVIDNCYFGNVIQTGNDAAYVARHVALKSGCSITTPALTVNRLCGSGFESVIQAADSIKLGHSSVVIAGGTENMSAAPLVADGNDARWGIGLGSGLKLSDSLWSGLTDAYAGTPMGITAENVAKQYNISRSECDEYAVRSQQLWGKANSANIFDAEMAPVEVVNKKKEKVLVSVDEHPRPETSIDKIGKLRPVFDPTSGVVTAANASGICDGAGSVIVASEDAVRKYNLTPLARIVSYGITGCDPKIMGIGPVSAIRMALDRSNLKLSDMDRIEINEAFAAQFLACAAELQKTDGISPSFDFMSRTNIHGGAISLGHPLGASGSRIVAHLANEFASTAGSSSNRYHVGSACIGGGQGIAVILERA